MHSKELSKVCEENLKIKNQMQMLKEVSLQENLDKHTLQVENQELSYQVKTLTGMNPI